MVSRAAFVAEQLAVRRWCEAGGRLAAFGLGHRWRRRSAHIHELVMRSHLGSILDADNTAAVCSDCHREIHDNPAISYSIGLLVRGV